VNVFLREIKDIEARETRHLLAQGSLSATPSRKLNQTLNIKTKVQLGLSKQWRSGRDSGSEIKRSR